MVAGRVCQVETLARTWAYLDSWSPVSLAGGGGEVVGSGIGVLRGPSVGSLKASCASLLTFPASVVLELLAGVSCGSSCEIEDSAEWKDSAREEDASGVVASCGVSNCDFSSRTVVPFMCGCCIVSTFGASAIFAVVD